MVLYYLLKFTVKNKKHITYFNIRYVYRKIAMKGREIQVNIYIFYKKGIDYRLAGG